MATGAIDRFPKVGNFSSYFRKVSSVWMSNDKKQGENTLSPDLGSLLIDTGLLRGDPDPSNIVCSSRRSYY
jgi:hypothetical protein